MPWMTVNAWLFGKGKNFLQQPWTFLQGSRPSYSCWLSSRKIMWPTGEYNLCFCPLFCDPRFSAFQLSCSNLTVQLSSRFRDEAAIRPCALLCTDPLQTLTHLSQGDPSADSIGEHTKSYDSFPRGKLILASSWINLTMAWKMIHSPPSKFRPQRRCLMCPSSQNI